MFGWEYPPQFTGGLGTACQGLVRGLLAAGARVDLVLPHRAGGASEAGLRILDAAGLAPADAGEPRAGALRTIWLDSPLTPYLDEETYVSLLRSPPGARYSLHGGYGPDLYREVFRYAAVAAEVAAESGFDVVHAHDWMTYPAGLAAREVSGRPFVAHVHSTEYDRTGGAGHPAVSAIEREGIVRADRVVCVSRYTAGIVAARYGVSPDRLRVVHNAIDAPEGEQAELEFGESEPVVLFAGRMTFQKGPDYFVEAARLVLESRPEVKFVLAGTGDMLPALLHRVAALGLGRSILFTGFLPAEDLGILYGRADLYVMPSVSEPFGLTALEALSRGVPVILSRHAGVGELVRSALKVDFWDVSELAARILSVLEFPLLRGEMSRQGRAEVRRFSWRQAADRCLEIYREVL